MANGFVKTLMLGVMSGIGCAAGGWIWKNGMEEKANELKQNHDKEKEGSSKTEENK